MLTQSVQEEHRAKVLFVSSYTGILHSLEHLYRLFYAYEGEYVALNVPAFRNENLPCINILSEAGFHTHPVLVFGHTRVHVRGLYN